MTHRSVQFAGGRLAPVVGCRKRHRSEVVTGEVQSPRTAGFSRVADSSPGRLRALPERPEAARGPIAGPQARVGTAGWRLSNQQQSMTKGTKCR